MEYKRVLAVEQEGDWYVIPIELKEYFNDLSSILSGEYDEDDSRNELISEAEDEFIQKFSQYMTGGDLNNVELYIKDGK